MGEHSLDKVNTVIIGAGPAGLACAGALKIRGKQAVVLEKSDGVGSVWRGHYDRLHLHTAKRYSGLPGFPMPKSYPRYPSRAQVVSYLEDYAAHHGIAPRFGVEVQSLARGGHWQVRTSTGIIETSHVIVAGGVASFPHLADWPGLDQFSGQLVHSSDYKNATGFEGMKMLVVGMGNSGGEIALDLAQAGLDTTISVRGPVNVIPRDVLGIPAQSFSVAERHLPYKMVDVVNGAITRLRMGDVTKLGLAKPSKGSIAQIIEDGRVPLIDVGTIAAIRDGSISVCGAISHVDGGQIHFADGASSGFDGIVLATGYKPDLREMLPDHGALLGETGAPATSGAKSGADGLFFCGYKVVPTGHLREIAIEAGEIADSIS